MNILSFPEGPRGRAWHRSDSAIFEPGQRHSFAVRNRRGLDCVLARLLSLFPQPLAPGSASCATLTTMTAVLTTLLGGCLAIAGELVGIALGDRRERSRWLRDSQWQASTALLSALQLVIRGMINISYLDERELADPASAVVAAFSEATIAWNSALYSGSVCRSTGGGSGDPCTRPRGRSS